jgi:hypothetical protein
MEGMEYRGPGGRVRHWRLIGGWRGIVRYGSGLVSACFHRTVPGGTGSCKAHESERKEDSGVEHDDDLFAGGDSFEKRMLFEGEGQLSASLYPRSVNSARFF